MAISPHYVLDRSGKQTVEQIERYSPAEFVSFSAAKPVAIKGGALWMRFSATTTDNQQGWRLTMPMATVDDVVLYNRNAAGQWVVQYGGDTRPMSTWAQPGRYPSFLLSTDTGRPVEYLLQVRHERGLFSTPPLVVTESAFISSRQDEHLVIGMYFGLAILAVVLALSRALVYRDLGFASYALYVSLMIMAIATVRGISSLYLWPELPLSTVMSPLLASLTGAAATWFVRIVTRPERFSRWLDLALLAMIFIGPLGGLASAIEPSGWGYTTFSAVALLNTAVLLTAMLWALWQKDFDSRWVALGFFPVVAAVFISLLRNFGNIADSALIELVVPVASAIEIVILFYGLHTRVSQRRSVATRVTRMQKIDPLTGLDSGPVLTTRLERALTAAQDKQQPYTLLVIKLANADTLQTQFGREMADRALVLAASTIRSAAPFGDALARVGPAEFALLMEGPVSAGTANGVATKVLANALRTTSGLPAGQALDLHIVVGQPGEGLSIMHDAQTLLARMLSALSVLKDSSGRAIRVVKL